jgi:MFS family permease
MTTGDIAESRARRWRWEALTGGGALLQEDGFRRLWLGRVCSHTALNAVLYTLLILAVGEGSSSIKSALFIAAYLLPTATLGTISGVLVDRLPKNLVLAAVNALRFGLMLVLLMSSTSLWTVYGVALLVATTSQFAAPGEAAAVPHIVAPEQLTAANTANNFGGLISQIAGYAILAPFFLNTVGPRPLFFVAAVLFAVSALFFLLIHHVGVDDVDLDDAVDAVRNVRHEFAHAWETLQLDIGAYMSVVIVVLASTASLVAVTLMPRFVHEVLGIPVQNAIYIFLPAAIGIFAGLRLVHALERRLPKGWIVGAGFALLIASFMCLAFTRPFGSMFQGFGLDPTPARIAATVVLSTGAAFSYSVLGVASRSLVNERTPKQIQGRVFAAQNVLTNLASIPPILLAGLLSQAFGVEAVLGATTIVLATVALWTTAQARSRAELRSQHA